VKGAWGCERGRGGRRGGSKTKMSPFLKGKERCVASVI